MLPRPTLTLLAVAGLAALALGGCGRRGALEPPEASASSAVTPNGAASSGVKTARILPGSIGLGGGQAEPDAESVRAGDELSPSAIPPSGSEAPVQTTKGAKRGYRIPKEPFILDPLL
jgi:predicted small lipoprotein YifL